MSVLNVDILPDERFWNKSGDRLYLTELWMLSPTFGRPIGTVRFGGGAIWWLWENGVSTNTHTERHLRDLTKACATAKESAEQLWYSIQADSKAAEAWREDGGGIPLDATAVSNITRWRHGFSLRYKGIEGCGMNITQAYINARLRYERRSV